MTSLRRLLVAPLLLLAVVVATVTDAPSSRAEAVTPPAHGEGAGIAMGGPWTWAAPEQQAADLAEVAASGAKWIRVSFPWSAMEPNAGQLNWGVHDRIVWLANAYGLKIIANVTYTPDWARPAFCLSSRCAPVYPERYAAFLGAAVRRYAPYGVRAWEIWNEPNLTQFWQPQPDPVGYSLLLRGAYVAAKAADPTVTVLTGGVAPLARDSQIGRTPIGYLADLYAAGAKGSFDAVGVHPYSYPRGPLYAHPTNLFYNLPSVHDLMVRNGDGDKAVWLTEYGFWTSNSALRPPGSVTPEEQAVYLRQAYAAVATWPWAGPLVWYTFRDLQQSSLLREDNFGLNRADGTDKPAMTALRNLLTSG